MAESIDMNGADWSFVKSDLPRKKADTQDVRAERRQRAEALCLDLWDFLGEYGRRHPQLSLSECRAAFDALYRQLSDICKATAKQAGGGCRRNSHQGGRRRG